MKKIILGLAIVFFASCKDEPVMKTTGIVKVHEVTSSQGGNATFHTLIECENGVVIDKEGMAYYILPIGTKCIVSYTKYDLY